MAFAGGHAGITCDRKKAFSWIATDLSQTVYLRSKWTGVIPQLPLGFRKAERVAVDGATKTVRLAGDSENRIYVYRF